MGEKKQTRRSKKQIEVDHSEDEIPETSEVQAIKVDTEAKPKQNDEFLDRCYQLMDTMTQNYRDQREELKKLTKQYKQELRNAKKNNKPRKNTTRTGFTKPETVPDDLATFVGLDKGSVMPRTELTKEVYNVFRNRGLYYEQDKRVLRTDEEVRRIFNLTADVDNSTDPRDANGLNFYNIQKYIARNYRDFENKKQVPAKKKKARTVAPKSA